MVRDRDAALRMMAEASERGTRGLFRFHLRNWSGATESFSGTDLIPGGGYW